MQVDSETCCWVGHLPKNENRTSTVFIVRCAGFSPKWMDDAIDSSSNEPSPVSRRVVVTLPYLDEARDQKKKMTRCDLISSSSSELSSISYPIRCEKLIEPGRWDKRDKLKKAVGKEVAVTVGRASYDFDDDDLIW